ncbi:TIGR03826 family flagellar region protein [Heyndrickxia sp. NPDC080065]|uniref:TIGR03826 family flagellar region protein n=1 Tax=Heyndrickxia sp. NPDC080065 TaxID=3390568 RepID=UPI003CFD8A7F
MAELQNCPRCGTLYVRNSFRDVCEKCYKEEEKKYEIVYTFLKKQENRSATKDIVVEKTGVDEELIFKWIRKGRLQLTRFPNLGYPCAKCGTIIREGKLCTNCISTIQNDLEIHEKEKIRKEQIHNQTYHSQ